MLTKIRSHASFSNVVAVLALFVALGGTSYAATQIGSKQIRNNSVRSIDIKNRTIKSKDIAKGVIGSTLQSTAGAGGRATWARRRRGIDQLHGGCDPRRPRARRLRAARKGQPELEHDARTDAAGSRRRATTTTRTAACAKQGTPEGHNLQLIHTFGGTGTAVLACRAAAGIWSAADAKLIAIKISAARSTVVSG